MLLNLVTRDLTSTVMGRRMTSLPHSDSLGCGTSSALRVRAVTRVYSVAKASR